MTRQPLRQVIVKLPAARQSRPLAAWDCAILDAVTGKIIEGVVEARITLDPTRIVTAALTLHNIRTDRKAIEVSHETCEVVEVRVGEYSGRWWRRI